jgi:mono/diheme cytochrome c family protein
MNRLALLLAAALAAPILPAMAEEGTYLPPVTDATVLKECGACHMVFPPQLLPARSWQKLMGDLSSHFGEDASLGAPASEAIATYLADHAADGPQTKGGKRFMAGLSATDAPLRISDTPFWQRAHNELSAAAFTTATVKSPANCIACHKTAARGEFTESD